MGLYLALIQLGILRVIVHGLIAQAYREMKELEALRTLELVNAVKLLSLAQRTTGVPTRGKGAA